MTKLKFTFTGVMLFLLMSSSFSQNYTISGRISNTESGELLIAANVFDTISLKGTTTNTYGFYSLTLPKGHVALDFSYVGYQSTMRDIELNKDIVLDISLSSSVLLQEIVVTSEKNTEKIHEETQMSKVEVPIEQIKKVPALLGEIDVLKTLQLLPGVQSGGEGTSGLYVRGGSPDQNLMLLDGVPVYNASHLLGFFSVFNADAIKNVTLYKGAFPARFGGRLSSIVDISMKEGNNKELHGTGSIGLISSKLAIEGPIKIDKASFIVSGRRTYLDILMRPFVAAANNQTPGKFTPKLYFYDLNAKVNYIINKKHRVFLSTYWGKDAFGVKESYDGTHDGNNSFKSKSDLGIDWGNKTTALRWNYEITNKLFLNTTLTHSTFNFTAGGTDESESCYNDTCHSYKLDAYYISRIRDYATKLDFDYFPVPNHNIKFGIGSIWHRYAPGYFQIDETGYGEAIDTTIGTDKLRSLEYNIYLEDDMQFGALKVNAGLHASAFIEKDGKGKYTSLQPRLGLRYLLPNDIAIKASYSTMRQYINLLVSGSIGLPSDLWLPSTDRIKPQESWIAAIGFAKTYKKEYEISLEGYYKKMDNLITYKEGASLLSAFIKDWQDAIAQGNGESYGAEFFIQKKLGRLTGWFGYTLSWNFRQFDHINNSEPYPFKYDRRHDISLVASYQLKKKGIKEININGAWIFGTGNAVTLSTYKYFSIYPPDSHNYSNFGEIESGGKKNSFRMPNYHRLDLSIEFVKQKKRHQRSWVFSIYNIYNRSNPLFIYADYDWERGNPDKKVFKQISLFRIIPSFSYQFKF